MTLCYVKVDYNRAGRRSILNDNGGCRTPPGPSLGEEGGRDDCTAHILGEWGKGAWGKVKREGWL